MKLRTACLVGLLAAGGALLPDFSHAGNTNISVIQISQGNAAIQICGSGCVQVLQQNNIAIVAVNQGGLLYAGSAYISSRTYDFGNVVHAKAHVFSLTNTSGSLPLIIPPGAIGMSGANPADFLEEDNCPVVLAPGRACSIQVTFMPDSTGGKSAVLAVRDSAIDSPNLVDLSGTGVAAWVTPSALDFGTVVVGVHSPSSAATIHNPGSDALAVTGIGLSGAAAGDFAAGGCATVPAGGTCGVGVTFTPTDGGARRASLDIGVAGLGGPFSVALGGAGAPLALSPAPLDFGSQRVSKPSTLNEGLKNLGTSPLTVTAMSPIGAAAGDYQAGGCGPLPFTLAGGASCQAPVTFTPSATGARTASLALTYTAAEMQFSASAGLTGSGVAPGFAFTPSSLDFGAHTVGESATLDATLSNPGGYATTISAMAISGGDAKDFSMTSECGSLPVTLAPGGSCVVHLTLKPSKTGDRRSSLKVTDDAGGSPHLLALSGSGVAAGEATGGGNTGGGNTGGGTGGTTGGVSGATGNTSGGSQTANAAVTSQISAAAGPGLPNTGRPAGSGPRMVGFVSPFAAGVELVWLSAVLLLLLVCVVSGLRGRRRPAPEKERPAERW